MRKKILCLLLPLLSLSMTSCEDIFNNGGKTETTLGKALKAMDEAEFALTGDVTHSYSYANPMVKKNDNTRKSTMTTSFTPNSWSNTTLDEGDDSIPYSVSYFKDEGGYLSTEYTKYDNTIGLTPILNYGVKELFDVRFENPFHLLTEDDFTLVDGVYSVSGSAAAMFVDHVFDEAYSEGTLEFTIENNAFVSVKGIGFEVDDYLIGSSDVFDRHKTLEFNLTVTDEVSTYHIEPEAEKKNTALERLFTAAKNKKFRVSNGGSLSSMGFQAYFDGEAIFATFSLGDYTEPQDFDFLLKPDSEGILQFQYYADGEWVDNNYEETEMYRYPTTYDVLCPDLGSVNANVFDATTSSTYDPSVNAVKFIGRNFVSQLYDYLNLSTMDCFRNSLTGFQISNVTDTSFACHAASTYNGNGFTVKTENYLIFDQIGTCELPYNLNASHAEAD